MNSATTENLYTLFGTEALADPFPLVAKIFDCIRNPNVETLVYHTPYLLGAHTLLQPDLAGMGRFSYLPTGERLYVRVRSYFGTSEVGGRALLPIEYGESREVSLLVTTIENPLKSGTLKIIVASWPTNEANHAPSGCASPPVCSVAPSQAAYGASAAPFVLMDAFVGKQKKAVSIGGYEALWSGSLTLIEAWDHTRNCAASTSVHRGIVNSYLAEWVAGVEKRSKVDLSVIFECSNNTLKQILTKSATKVHKTLEHRRNHPDKNVAADPRVNDYTEATRIANFFLEHGTLGAFVDLLARDAFRGVKVGVFNSPTKFPLYMTACVLLAVFPEMARLPHTGRNHRDDRASANVLIGMFRSLTSGVDSSSGQRTTAIEAILAVSCDGIGSFVDPSCSRSAPKRQLKSVYSRRGGEVEQEENNHVPYSLEHMRRQGAALIQELFGHFPSELQTWMSTNHVDFLGKEANDAAVDSMCDKVSKANLCELRRVSGATGSTAMATPRSLRHSSRESMQRVVLELMVEVNTFLSDGTFRTYRYVPENTPSEDATHGPSTGLKRNALACRTAHAELMTYFTSGVSALITDGIPRVMCLRHTTSVKCGDCGDDFDPLWSLPKDNLALCEECNVHFCHGCYLERIKKLRAVNNGDTITLAVMNDNKNLLRCARCMR